MVFAGVIYCGDPVFLSYQISSEMDEDRDIDRDTCFWNLGVLFYQTLVSVDPLTFERISFLILPISKALIALWFLEIGHIGCMLFSKVTYREIRFMIGLVFTIGNIFLSQQNIGVDLNNMSLGIHPPLFCYRNYWIFWSTICF